MLSFVNTKLRDECSSLADFCDCYGVEEEEITVRFSALGYFYDEAQNSFIRS